MKVKWRACALANAGRVVTKWFDDKRACMVWLQVVVLDNQREGKPVRFFTSWGKYLSNCRDSHYLNVFLERRKGESV